MRRLSIARTIALLLCVVSSVSFINPASGWMKISHCWIGEQTGTGPGYNNVPDYWRSFSYSRFGVSWFFYWSHECKERRSRIGVPVYNRDLPNGMDDSPSEYMPLLYNTRILSATPSMSDSITGWRSHNAADQEVHFDFFIGGNPWRWFQHYRRERAADMLVYVKKIYLDRPDLAFRNSGQGRAVGYVFTSLACGDADSDRLILLAQKAFRKKQATMKLEPRPAGFTGLGVQNIAGLRAERQGMERGLDPSRMFSFNRSSYDYALSVTAVRQPIVGGKERWERELEDAIDAVNAAKTW